MVYTYLSYFKSFGLGYSGCWGLKIWFEMSWFIFLLSETFLLSKMLLLWYVTLNPAVLVPTPISNNYVK